MDRVEKLREYIDNILVNKEDADDRRCAYVHLYGVAQACALIALKRGADAELPVIAGMLHDLYVYRIKDIENHADRGAVYAREVLDELKITTDEETNAVCAAIHNHSDKSGAFSELDEILIDADVMQHCLYNPLFPINKHEADRFRRLLDEFGIKTRPDSVKETK